MPDVVSSPPLIDAGGSFHVRNEPPASIFGGDDVAVQWSQDHSLLEAQDVGKRPGGWRAGRSARPGLHAGAEGRRCGLLSGWLVCRCVFVSLCVSGVRAHRRPPPPCHRFHEFTTNAGENLTKQQGAIARALYAWCVPRHAVLDRLVPGFTGLDIEQQKSNSLDRMLWRKPIGPIEGKQVARDNVLHNVLSAMCLAYKEGEEREA